MAVFGLSTIKEARPYWLEQIPYTQLITSVAANSQVPVQATVQQWNPADDPQTAVILDGIAATTLTGIQWWLLNDKDQGRVDLGTLPADLVLVDPQRVAVQSLSSYLVNPTPYAVTNLQLLYRYTIWHDTLAWRVLRGLPLTPAQQQTLRSLGLETTSTSQRGTLPMTLDRIIDGTYRPRLVRAPLNYALTVQASPQDFVFHVERALPNQLLVLRSIAAEANPEDGVTLTIDRDADQAHVQLDCSFLRVDRPLQCFIPALTSLSFHIQAQTTPAMPTPIRLEIWTVALSNILRLRMGLVTADQLAGEMGADQARKLAAAVAAGMV